MLWYTTRGAGAVSLVLLTAVVALGILSSLRFEAKGWPRFLTAGLHRNLALVTLVFLGLHIVTAVVDPYTNLGWASAIVPFSSYYRTFWLGLGTIAAELVAAIGITSFGDALGIEREKIEVNMLYGIQAEALVKLAKEGHTARQLIAYGPAWYVWYIRRLAERPANVLFVARQMVG